MDDWSNWPVDQRRHRSAGGHAGQLRAERSRAGHSKGQRRERRIAERPVNRPAQGLAQRRTKDLARVVEVGEGVLPVEPIETGNDNHRQADRQSQRKYPQRRAF